MASAVTQSRTPRKKAATPSKKASGAGDPSTVDRSRMIAEAAYYLAEQRGFSGGDPVQDWLDAEAIIDQMQTPKATGRKTKAK